MDHTLPLDTTATAFPRMLVREHVRDAFIHFDAKQGTVAGKPQETMLKG